VTTEVAPGSPDPTEYHSDPFLAPVLAWGIKDSFRAYVTAVGGTLEVTPPAETSGARYLFPGAADQEKLGEQVLTFAGTVSCTAHQGLMRFVAADPWIHFTDSHSARFSIAADPQGANSGTRLYLANLTIPEPTESHGLLRWTAVETRLAQEGAVAFDFNYPSGIELAAVSFSWPAGG
jgi:large repetitive protein